jgi:hypothetical protein
VYYQVGEISPNEIELGQINFRIKLEFKNPECIRADFFGYYHQAAKTLDHITIDEIKHIVTLSILRVK